MDYVLFLRIDGGVSMDEKILILYKNHTFDLMGLNELESIDMSGSHIQCILIPFTDVVNGYIPIKPSFLCTAHHVHVKIIYQGFQIFAALEGNWDEEDYEENFPLKIFEVDCFNIIDMVNAIYNLLKFRGTSIFLGEKCIAEFPVEEFDGYYNYPREYQFDFYDENDNLFYQISTGLMRSLLDRYTNEFAEIDDPSIILGLIDEALISSSPILYLPDKKELPGMIQLTQTHWTGIRKPMSELSSEDFILTYDDSYGIYYFSTYGLYLNFLKSPHTDVYIYGLVLDLTMEGSKGLLTSIDQNKIPSTMEKLEVYHTLRKGSQDYITPITMGTTLREPTDLIKLILFLPHIVLSLKCCLLEIYGRLENQQLTLSKDLRVRTLVVFNYGVKQYDNEQKVLSCYEDLSDPGQILTEMELDHKSIMLTLSNIIPDLL